MNDFKRKHYVVSCKDKECSLDSQDCQCCQACKRLKFNRIQYKIQGVTYIGYHFEAHTSIYFQAAKDYLIGRDVQDFELIACGPRARVKNGEIGPMEQGLKRPAPLDEDFEEEEEEVVTKQRRSSILKGVKIEVPKEYSRPDPKLQALYKRVSELERDKEKTFLQLSQTHRQIFGLIKGQNALFKGIKTVQNTSEENFKNLKSTTTQIKKDVKTLQNDQNKMTELIFEQNTKFEEAFKAESFKTQEQTRNSSRKPNSTGLTSASPSVQKSKSRFPASVERIVLEVCENKAK